MAHLLLYFVILSCSQMEINQLKFSRPVKLWFLKYVFSMLDLQTQFSEASENRQNLYREIYIFSFLCKHGDTTIVAVNAACWGYQTSRMESIFPSNLPVKLLENSPKL